MNVATSESRKAVALDAWRRGDLNTAGAAYGELASEYERHHFGDGLLAVRFNHLLVALEAGDRPRVDALMANLGSQFLQTGDASPMASDIAGRICRLFAEPMAGVDHQATGALVALAADKALERPDPVAPADAVEPLPAADALAGLNAIDAALMIFQQAERRVNTDDPPWLSAVRRVFGRPTAISAHVAVALRSVAQCVSDDDLLHAYPPLVDALEWAVERNAPLAAEWVVGLEEFERRGLPDRLRYVPTLPEERRLRATLALHARLAEALVGEAGAEALARQQWRAVRTLGRRWFDELQARAARGGGRAEDVTHEAVVGIALARALRIDQAFGEADELLAASAARARRDAFDDRLTGARVLCEAAELRERMGDVAEDTWLAAVEVAVSGVEAASGTRRLARIIDQVLFEDRIEQTRVGIIALAGLARTGARELAGDRLERARILLSMLRPALDSEEATQAALAIELTASRLGLDGAAERAIEAAQLCGDRQALALAALSRARIAWGLAADDGARAEALELFSIAAGEARQTAASAIRRGVEAVVAEAHQAQGFDADPARVEIHFRRAVEAAEGAAFADGTSRWDHLLPSDLAPPVSAVVQQLLDADDPALARRLCAAGRARRVLASPGTSPAAEAIAAAHRAAFCAEWLDGESAPDADRAMVYPEAHATTWLPLRVSDTDLQVEFRVFEEVTFLFALDAEGLTAHRLDTGRRAWATDVDALRDASKSVGTRLEAVGTAIHNRLLGVVNDRIARARRVILVPDGPLVDLPFGLLRGDDGALGEGLEMVIASPASAPRFSWDGDIAPPTARILGDDATARDLRISTLSGQGFFSAVDVRHGADLQDNGLNTAVDQARVVHLLGQIGVDGTIALASDGPGTSLDDLGGALADGGAVCATLMGPVEGLGGQAAIAAILPGVRGGVLVRRWATEEDGSFLLHFLGGAAHATDTWALAEALAAARRAAVRACLPPSVWAAYALFVPETP